MSDAANMDLLEEAGINLNASNHHNNEPRTRMAFHMEGIFGTNYGWLRINNKLENLNENYILTQKTRN